MKRGAPACPQCGNRIEAPAQNRYRPFCSERCKLADLGQWFAGRYAIPAESESESGLEPDAAPAPAKRQ